MNTRTVLSESSLKTTFQNATFGQVDVVIEMTEYADEHLQEIRVSKDGQPIAIYPAEEVLPKRNKLRRLIKRLNKLHHTGIDLRTAMREIEISEKIKAESDVQETVIETMKSALYRSAFLRYIRIFKKSNSRFSFNAGSIFTNKHDFYNHSRAIEYRNSFLAHVEENSKVDPSSVRILTDGIHVGVYPVSAYPAAEHANTHILRKLIEAVLCYVEREYSVVRDEADSLLRSQFENGQLFDAVTDSGK